MQIDSQIDFACCNSESRMRFVGLVLVGLCGLKVGAKIGVQVAPYLTNKHSGCGGWLCMTFS